MTNNEIKQAAYVLAAEHFCTHYRAETLQADVHAHINEQHHTAKGIIRPSDVLHSESVRSACMLVDELAKDIISLVLKAKAVQPKKPQRYIERIDLPDTWASALVNGDWSGLDAGEQDELRHYLAKYPQNASPVDCGTTWRGGIFMGQWRSMLTFHYIREVTR